MQFHQNPETSLFSKMSMKDDFLFLKDKHQSSQNGNQYSTFNLNQNHKCPENKSPIQSHSNQSSHDKHYDSTISDNYEEKEKSQAWNESSKTALSSEISHFAIQNNEAEEEKDENFWKKESNTTTFNNSTLSLYIAAYETAGASDSFDDKNNENLKNQRSGPFKEKENAKQIISTLFIRNLFEFPRQQNDRVSEPEMSQFNASQRLFNPNEASNNSQQGSSRERKKASNRRFNSQNGVILENNLNDPTAPIVYTILDFKKHQSFYVLRNCYKPPPSEGDNKEMALQVFDNINYEADGKNLIREQITRNEAYFKGKNTCKELSDGTYVVKATCVFSPGDPTKCFTNICGEIECAEELYTNVLLANISFDCWLQFTFVKASDVNLNSPSINAITYKFHSLEKVNTNFDFAYNAPWNKSAPRKMYDQYDPFTNSLASQKPQKIFNLRAYFLSRAAIYIPGKPRIPILLALKEFSNCDGIELKPHMAIIVNVCYCEILQRFIVFEMKRCDGLDLQASLTEDNYHEVNLSPIYKCPGFFCFGKNGLVHDKYGQLAEYYNEVYGPKSVFCYADPDDCAYTSLEIPQTNKILLSELQQIRFEGIYIGNKEFYSPHLHYCSIFAEDDGEYKVGHWYYLNAETLDDEKFIVTASAVLIEEFDHIPSKKIGDNYEFLVEITVERCAIFQFAAAPFLGAIGLKESDVDKCFNGSFGACGIQFPLRKELPDHRPQVRPNMVRGFKDVQQGMLTGNYK